MFSFPFLDSFISENKIQLNPELAANMKEHWENLIADFDIKTEIRILDRASVSYWRHPIRIVKTNEKDEVTEFSCDGSLQ
jgi:hypothetical protein